MKTSAAGVRALIAREGVVLHPYNDSAGNATIGVGHLLHMGPVTQADRARWSNLPMSQGAATALLKRDLARFEAAVKTVVKVPVSQGEFDALVSFAFNIGTGGFASSTVVRELNRGNRKAAAAAFMLWRKPPEIIGRRKSEQAQFVKAGPPRRAMPHLTAHERELCKRADLFHYVRREPIPFALKADLLAARKRVWRAAQGPGGWDRLHRRERYRSLLVRSR